VGQKLPHFRKTPYCLLGQGARRFLSAINILAFSDRFPDKKVMVFMMAMKGFLPMRHVGFYVLMLMVIFQGSSLAAAPKAKPAPAAPAEKAAPAQSIHIMGSSSVYPFVTAAAEQFGRDKAFKTPIVEATGTGSGFKLFCAGVDLSSPDVVNASRPVKDSEKALCASNGVTEVMELKIGFDGIVVGQSKAAKDLSISKSDLQRALAAKVVLNGKLVLNPYQNWSDVRPDLPVRPITVYGPPTTSGTRDAFVEMVMEAGCEKASLPKSLTEADVKAACETMREDGRYIEAGENDNLIIQRLEVNADALGLFGYSFLEQNADRIKAVSVDGQQPTIDTISSAQYPISRSLFVYVKKAHIPLVPGLKEFATLLVSDDAVGDLGIMVEKGLIPLPAVQQNIERQKVEILQALTFSAPASPEIGGGGSEKP
jgi:phosphate transport system substrate-binding protein